MFLFPWFIKRSLWPNQVLPREFVSVPFSCTCLWRSCRLVSSGDFFLFSSIKYLSAAQEIWVPAEFIRILSIFYIYNQAIVPVWRWQRRTAIFSHIQSKIVKGLSLWMKREGGSRNLLMFYSDVNKEIEKCVSLKLTPFLSQMFRWVIAGDGKQEP